MLPLFKILPCYETFFDNLAFAIILLECSAEIILILKFASITIHNSQRTKISHTLAELVERRTTVCAHAYHPRVVGSNLVYVRTLFSLFCGFVNSSSSTKLIKQWSLDKNKRFPELCFSRMSATVSGSELCMELICRRKSVLNAILLP